MLNEGTVIKTAAGGSVVVREHIKSDDIFDYYKALYSLCPCILKWYKAPPRHHRKIYKNLRLLSKMDYPYPYTFLWPIDITRKMNGSFGIITEEVPDNYAPLCDAAKSLTDTEKCECCLEIIGTFNQLEKTGCSYYTFSGPHNIFLDTKNKKSILMGNCDELLAPTAKLPYWENDPKYTAPELCRNQSLPNSSSNTFSLAVVVFTVMFGIEPLVYSSTGDLQFVFEGDAASSYPEAAEKWDSAPKDVQAAFENIFSEKALHSPEKRCSADKLRSAFYSWQRQLYNGFLPFYIWGDVSESMSCYLLKPWRYRKYNKKKNIFTKLFKI